jgi:predicted nucleic acid-binding protein
MILPARLIVDASVAIKWVVGEAGSERAELLLDRRLVAPDLLCVECANVLWKKVRRRELTEDEAAAAIELLENAEIELVSMRSYMTAATVLAVEFDHPAYDCIYLALAEALDLPLVTADESLARRIRKAAADRFGHRLIPLSELTV